MMGCNFVIFGVVRPSGRPDVNFENKQFQLFSAVNGNNEMATSVVYLCTILYVRIAILQDINSQLQYFGHLFSTPPFF